MDVFFVLAKEFINFWWSVSSAMENTGSNISTIAMLVTCLKLFASSKAFSNRSFTTNKICNSISFLFCVIIVIFSLSQIAMSQEAELDLALVPEAESIVYSDKSFLQSRFVRTARTLILMQVKKKVSAEEYRRIYNYLKAFSEFDFLYSVNFSNAIDKAGTRFSYEKVDWMIGWKDDNPIPFWNNGNKANIENISVEILRLAHYMFVSQILDDEKLRFKLQLWEFKSSHECTSIPGWKLFPVSISLDVTTTYELLWAVSEDNKLFFLGPAATVIRQLTNAKPPATEHLAALEQLRRKTGRKSRLAKHILVKEKAVSKIDNLFLDFRRSGDMALQQYLIRTSHCNVLLEANDDMQINVEVQFKDSITADDFYCLLKEMSLKTAISFFTKKGSIDNIAAIKNTKIEKQDGNKVSMATLIPLKDLIDSMSKEDTPSQ